MSIEPDVTDILLQQDERGLERIVPILYDELKRVARAQLAHESRNHTLQPTALVHEAYLRLVNIDRMTVEGRAHFLGLAARLMRQILVDHARRKRADIRGGDVTIVGLDDAIPATSRINLDLLALDTALTELGSFDPRQRDLVELKFFGGLTIAETAAALNISTAMVEREWTIARAWLYHRLAGRGEQP